MKKLLRKLTVGMAILASSLFVIHTSPALAVTYDPCDTDHSGTVSNQEALTCGTNNAAGVSSGTASPSDTLDNTIKEVLNILSIAAGVAAVVMIVVAGVRFTTSSGNQEAVAGARRSIVYAVIGLVIVALAQIIVHFVLNNLENPQPDQAPTTQTTTPSGGGTPSGGNGSGSNGNSHASGAQL